MKAAAAAAGCLVIGFGAGFFAGWASGTRPAEERALRAEETRATLEAERGELSVRLQNVQKALDAANAKVESERAEAEKRLGKAAEELAAARKEAEDLRSPARAPAPPAKPTAAKGAGPRFVVGEYEGVLKELDWERIGASMSAMPPLLKDLVDRARKGEPLDAENLGKIQQLNGPLLASALKIGDRIPGSGVNSKFTHPVFASNAIAAALDAAGMPLSDTQAEALGKTAQEFADRDRARLAGYDDRTWALQRILDEAGLRDAFYETAFAILTAQQGESLRPETSRGYLGLDLFSSGLVWGQHILPVFAPDRAGAQAQLVTTAASFLNVPEERKADLVPLAKEWMDGIPGTWLEGGENLFGQPLMKVEYIEDCARTQLVILKKIAENPAFGEETARRARGADSVALPFKR